MSKTKPLPSNLPKLIAALILLLVVAGLVWMIKGFIDSAKGPRKLQVQEISLVKPPPPKPPEEKPPELKPPESKDEVKLADPVPQAPPPPTDAPPPQAGLAPGPANGMQTDLAAGSGLQIGGGGGGGAGSREGWYSQVISRYLEDGLRRSKRLHGEEYEVTVQVWFDNGDIKRVQLVQGSGNPQTDEALRQALLALPPFSETIPPDLPQPVRIRVVSRG
ncbi:MAG: energy transducer TonB [Thiobacillaceae bacterium]